MPRFSTAIIIMEIIGSLLLADIVRGQEAALPANSEYENSTKPVDASVWLRAFNKKHPRAAASPGMDGARWRVKTRPLRITVDLQNPRQACLLMNHSIWTPFENYLLSRSLSDGRYGLFHRSFPDGRDGYYPLFTLEEPVEQIAGSANRMSVAFTLDSSNDIMFRSGGARGEVRRLVGHEAKPWRILLSPDGSRLVSCADDGTIRLWDLKSGEQIKKMPAYGGFRPIRGEFVAFSPDGRWLATAQPEQVALRRPSDGVMQLAMRLPPMTAPTAIRFAPDSQSLFVFNAFSQVAHPGVRFSQVGLYKYNIGTRHFKGSHRATDGVFTPDAKRVVTWHTYAPKVSVWRIEDRKETFAIKVAPKVIYDVVMVPSGKAFATLGDDHVVKFWDVFTGKRRETKIEYVHDEVALLRFSPDGKTLVTHGNSGLLKVWDAPKFAWEPVLGAPPLEQ